MAQELHAEEILKLEFEYANKTAEQAQDDRTAILNLYLLLAGGVGSITVALPQLGFPAASSLLPPLAYTLTLGLVGIAGFFVFFQLIRLRQAWYDSALTMNRIKDFYLEKFPDLEPAFRWRTHTIPPLGKLATITFNLAMLVAIIDSAAIGVALFFLNLRLANSEYLVPAFAAILYFCWQLWFYFFQLREN
jgi:hypothetical protein